MAAPKGYDFSGYATKYNVLCSDGRTILPGAFDRQKTRVPLVDMHNHKTLEAVIGHALLEHRDDGLYAYCYLNQDTPGGRYAKALVSHGDIDSMSIWANELKQSRGKISHGDIKELSLVMAGANKGAKIEFVEPNLAHGDLIDDDEMDDMFNAVLIHSGIGVELPTEEESEVTPEEPEQEEEPTEEPVPETEESEDHEMAEELQHAELNDDMSIKEAYESLDEKTRDLVDYLVGSIVAEEMKGEKETMAHGGFNLFEGNASVNGEVISHDDLQTLMSDVFKDMKNGRMMKDSLIEHAASYGIENIDILFPEATMAEADPGLVNRDQKWVEAILAGVHKLPFAKVKMAYADITPEDARAKGYIKGKFKSEEVFSLLKRTISPTTVYKKQKLDRDDMIDISKDFSIIPFVKSEMRLKLNEELARAYMFGDGRLTSSDDKIKEDCIVPVINDHDFFVLRYGIAGTVDAAFAEAFIDGAVRSRKGYKGSGNAIMLTSEEILTEMLLLKDTNKHRIYKSVSELATAMRVDDIITVPFLDEGVKDKDGKDIYGVIVNLDDYGVGVDKGGEINTFDDFDIDHNQQKWLMETRCSGGLRKPFSAIVLRKADATGTEAPGLAAAIADMKEKMNPVG